MLRPRFLFWGTLFFALSQPVASSAQVGSAALQSELDSVYQRLLADPANQALNRRLIDIAVQLDDYDAAIGAVERLIFYDPDNAALQLEAARLYAQIDSYAAAAGYLTDALALASITPAERQEAETLLRQANRATRPSPWSGFGQVGARYQSNANRGSVALGLNEPLPFEGPVEDWNSFALGTLGLAVPVDDNVTLEAALSGYYADQEKIDRLDLGFAEFTAGPRLASTDGTVSIKPYGLVQAIMLGGEEYQTAYGGGALVRFTYSDGWWVEPQYEYKDRTFYNTDDYETARDQTGDLSTYALNMNALLAQSVNLSSRIAYNENRARKSYQSYDQYRATIALEVGFDLFGVENWSVTPFYSYAHTDFRGIAPTERFAGLKTKRKDRQWSVGGDLEIPVRENVALGVAVEYTKNKSNLDRDKYEDWTVVVGPQGRF
ncbi:surface lipoprotein assembly modifier [Bauldia sp.]|uniref:surface lipoprotein assembly modifier n=1 Tax=Bauldia sp. TaxID=2575872 RepID=UPI003BAC5376